MIYEDELIIFSAKLIKKYELRKNFHNYLAHAILLTLLPGPISLTAGRIDGSAVAPRRFYNRKTPWRSPDTRVCHGVCIMPILIGGLCVRRFRVGGFFSFIFIFGGFQQSLRLWVVLPVERHEITLRINPCGFAEGEDDEG